ncbi:isoprenoid biosynthesis protein ElbB, partial [Bacteroidota bacterium]
ELTIGDDKDTAAAIQNMGARHKDTDHGEVIIDKKNKIVSNPCYMLDANIVQIAEGANNVVRAMIKL